MCSGTVRYEGRRLKSRSTIPTQGNAAVEVGSQPNSHAALSLGAADSLEPCLSPCHMLHTLMLARLTHLRLINLTFAPAEKLPAVCARPGFELVDICNGGEEDFSQDVCVGAAVKG